MKSNRKANGNLKFRLSGAPAESSHNLIEKLYEYFVMFEKNTSIISHIISKTSLISYSVFLTWPSSNEEMKPPPSLKLIIK